MPDRFSFDRALGFPFRAAHAKTFPWIYGVAYALVNLVVFGAVMFLARGAFVKFFAAAEALEDAQIDEDHPAEVFGAVFGLFGPLVPWMVVMGLASWVIWAMFQSASMRRYIRDENFSLRFGGDETRMMVLGLLWFLMGLVIWALPMAMMFGGIFSAVSAGIQGDLTEDEMVLRMMGGIFGGMGIMALLFPVYVFFATRLAPSFALTIKEGELKFQDAFNVSRGRFWPILGAFLILAVGGGMIVAVVEQVFQFVLMGSMMPTMESLEGADTPEEVLSAILRPGVLIPFGIYVFISVGLRGVLQHVAGAPAAFAARHDPRGSVDDALRVGDFD
ncbi:MAG: hypothetical protein KDA53_13490 [Hyphomonas sp.]|nr:hypothetical protein [Hyphomonas sp.]